MPRDDTVHGTLGRFDRPIWEPLLELVGDYLIADFMWMCEIDVDDGSVIHAYKHSATRRYLHVHESDGRTFMYLGSDRYHVTHPGDAIDDVFEHWEYLVGDADDREEIRAAIDAARARACDRVVAPIEEA
jgi:hypothetical protein